MSKFSVPARGERAPGLRWLARGRDRRPLGREGVVAGGRGEDAAVGDGGKGLGDEGVLVAWSELCMTTNCKQPVGTRSAWALSRAHHITWVKW